MLVERPLLLDLFCGAGGAAMGYHRAGFDVVGVDVDPQRHFPFEFHQADAMDVLVTLVGGRTWEGYILADFAAIHASPPCQDHSALKTFPGLNEHGTGWMLEATLTHLTSPTVSQPWVVENVEAAKAAEHLGWCFTLCGSTFGLGVRRHRRFWSSHLMMPPPCRHREQGPVVTVAGHSGGVRRASRSKATAAGSAADWRFAMGVDWMNRDELAQAIPPAYTEWIGQHLLAGVSRLR